MFRNADSHGNHVFGTFAILAITLMLAAFASGLFASPSTAYADDGAQTVVGTMTITMQKSGGDDVAPSGDTTPTDGTSSNNLPVAGSLASTGDGIVWLALGLSALIAACVFLYARSRQFATNAESAGAHVACYRIVNSEANSASKSTFVVAISAIVVACLCFGMLFTAYSAFAKSGVETLNGFSATSSVVVDENGKVLSNNLNLANDDTGDFLATIKSVAAPTELSGWNSNVATDTALAPGESVVSDWATTTVPASVLDKIKAEGSVALDFQVSLTTSGKTAFAVYSADQGTLNFYKRYKVPVAGDTFDGTTATAVYTGFEDAQYDCWTGVYAPWYTEATYQAVASANVIDEGVKPKHLSAWFYDMEALESVDLGKLDTSEVDCMDFLFSRTNLKTFDASTLDYSNVTIANRMFEYCGSLKTIENSDSLAFTDKLTNAEAMFLGCDNMTSLDLSSMDTSGVTNMHAMFYYCEALTEVKGMEGWSTSSVTDMSQMFYYCGELKANLRNWNVDKVTSHRNFHDGAEGVLSPFDVLDFDKFTVDTADKTYTGSQIAPTATSSYFVKNQEYEVVYGDNVNAGTGTITIRGVRGWQGEKTYEFKINKADPVPSTTLDAAYDLGVNEQIQSIELPTCANGTYAWANPMASYDSVGTQTTAVTFTPSDTANYNTLTLAQKLNVKEGTAFAVYVAGDDQSLTFYKRLKVPAVGDTFDGKTVAKVYTGFDSTTYSEDSPFNDSAAEIKTVSVADSGIAPTSLAYWFYKFTSLSAIDLSKLDTSNVTSTNNMLAFAVALKTFDASMIDFTNVDDMKEMFASCYALETITNSSSITGADGVVVESLFDGDCSLRSVDLAKLNTSKTTSLDGLFSLCAELTEVRGVQNWNTSSVTNMKLTFNGCSALKVDVSDWNIDEVAENTAFNQSASGVISPFDLKFSDFNVNTSSVTYDGSQKTPEVTSTKYKKDVQYTIAYGDNVNAGTGTIRVAAAGLMNGEKTYSFTIAQANPTPSAALANSYTLEVGHALSDITLPTCDNGIYSWSEPTQSYDKEGAQTVKVVFTPSDSANYKSIELDVNINVKSKTNFVVYSTTDKSLRFYNRLEAPAVGDEFDGRIVTNVATTIDNSAWSAIADIETIVVEDEGVKPAGTSMESWFGGLTSLATVNLCKLDVSAVANFKNLFSGDTSLTSVDTTGWNTSAATEMSGMFESDIELTEVKGVETWDTSNVQTMNQTFNLCKKLNADLRKWNVSSVTSHQRFNDDAPGVFSPFDLNFDKFTVDTSTVTYSGAQQKPKVTADGYTENDDYTVAYGENKNAGTGTITVTGAGQYSGSNTWQFTIGQAVPVPSATLPLTYSLAKGMPVVAAVGIPLCDDGSYNWYDINLTWSEAGTYTTQIIYHPYDETNYKQITYDVSVEVY